MVELKGAIPSVEEEKTSILGLGKGRRKLWRGLAFVGKLALAAGVGILVLNSL